MENVVDLWIRTIGRYSARHAIIGNIKCENISASEYVYLGEDDEL